MSSIDELLGDIPVEKDKTGKGKKKWDNPADNIESGAAEAVTVKRSMRAGQYIRRQFTFRPAQLNRIKQQARKLRVPEADLVRWLVDRGMQAIEEGEKPDTIEVSTTRLAPIGK